MELKEAIEKFKNKRNELQEDVNSVEDYVNTLEDEEWIEAIDIVLEELNNRIPRKDIEDKIEKVRCETTWGYNDWKYDKKVYNAEHNMINIIEKELLNKE